MFKCGAAAEHAPLNQLLCVNQLRFLWIVLFPRKSMGYDSHTLLNLSNWSIACNFGHQTESVATYWLVVFVTWGDFDQVQLCPISFAQHHHCEEHLLLPLLAFLISSVAFLSLSLILTVLSMLTNRVTLKWLSNEHHIVWKLISLNHGKRNQLPDRQTDRYEF